MWSWSCVVVLRGWSSITKAYNHSKVKRRTRYKPKNIVLIKIGFAQYLPNEVSIETKEEFEDKICSALGGRIAEEEFFGKITTGASDDLNKVHRYARHMVTKLGFAEEKLGYITYSENQFGKKGYSEETNIVIDQEVNRIVNQCVDKARAIIKEKREVID